MLIAIGTDLAGGRRRLWRNAVLGLCAMAVLIGASGRMVSNETPSGIPGFPSFERTDGPSELEIAYAFAPLIFHEVAGQDEEFSTRADFLTRFDFDGDRQTNNNKESLLARAAGQSFRADLKASLYYALVETETHWFITYHFYHALDWSPVPDCLGLGTAHENDGENVLVVVEKDGHELKGRIVMAAIQAHNEMTLFKPRGELSGDIAAEQLLQLSSDGTRPVIYVESQGHALRAQLAGASVRYRPTSDHEASSWAESASEYHYQLLSVRDELWLPFVAGRDLGDGGVMDGSFSYPVIAGSAIQLPAFYDSDMLSFCLTNKRDAGVLPFRMGFQVTMGDSVGNLFFRPAEELAPFAAHGRPWSTEYVWHPYCLSAHELAPDQLRVQSTSP